VNLWDNPGSGQATLQRGFPGLFIIAGKMVKENRAAVENGWNRDANETTGPRFQLQTFA
jgi:hypothetical protein